MQRQKVSVIILNDFPMSSSIGVMFQDYHDAVNGYGSVYSFTSSGPVEKYPGIRTDPVHFLGLLNNEKISRHYMLNQFIYESLGPLAWNSFRKWVKENSDKSIIHYSNNRIKPFTQGEMNVVTMNDLIYTKTKEVNDLPAKIRLLRNNRYFIKFENIISISDFVRKELIDYGFEGKITTIYQPTPRYFHMLNIDKKDLRKELALPLDKILLLSVSTNRSGKNLKSLAGLMDILDDRYRLIRVGTPVGNSISFTRVSNETLNLIYNACDALVFPSTDEGFGKPVAEAFKVGLPVLASNIEVMREICGDSAILVEPNPKGLKNGLIELLNSKDEFIKKGIERSKQFEFDVFSQKLRNYYISIFKKY